MTPNLSNTASISALWLIICAFIETKLRIFLDIALTIVLFYKNFSSNPFFNALIIQIHGLTCSDSLQAGPGSSELQQFHPVRLQNSATSNNYKTTKTWLTEGLSQ